MVSFFLLRRVGSNHRLDRRESESGKRRRVLDALRIVRRVRERGRGGSGWGLVGWRICAWDGHEVYLRVRVGVMVVRIFDLWRGFVVGSHCVY